MSHPASFDTCTVCASPAQFMCAMCGASTKYCSETCQAQDWPSHQLVCGEGRAGGDGADSEVTVGEAGRASSSRRSSAAASMGAGKLAYAGRISAAHAINEGTAAASPAAHHRRHRAVPEGNVVESTDDAAENDDEEMTEEERAEELRFYVTQIYLIVKPVLACIILSIFWVKIANSGKSDYRPTGSASQIYNEQAGTSAGDRFVGSLTNALIIIGQIIVMTIIIACLFKYGKIRILMGFFMLVVAVLLGFMGYLLELNLLQVFAIPMDYVTFVFGLYNFAITGLVMVFYPPAPLLMQQIFLTIMSSLMAFSLTGLAEWTTWILLGLLAVWDLIAVLCPFGPLKILIEASKSQGKEVPALLYTVNAVWLMAFDTNMLSRSSVDAGRSASPATISTTQAAASVPLLPALTPTGDRRSAGTIASIRSERVVSSGSLPPPLSPRVYLVSDEDEAARRSSSASRQYLRSSTGTGALPESSESPNSAAVRALSASTSVDSASAAGAGHQRQFSEYELGAGGTAAAPPSPPIRDPNVEEEAEDDERSGLKLGLGDFVFYSVLVARAALSDWVTTIACAIAVLMGLNATIFLLAIKRKALPALPISIAFGMVFYFVGSIMVTPMLETLAVAQIML